MAKTNKTVARKKRAAAKQNAAPKRSGQPIQPSRVPSKPSLVVGIGASAGGLDAFKTLFTSMPPDSGMAFIVVQHLSPDHKSMLAELLGRVTPMEVVEAVHDARVEPNSVYVIPPDATLTVKEGRLRVSRPAPPREHRRPIDTFFPRSRRIKARMQFASSLRVPAVMESSGVKRPRSAGG